MWRRLAAPAQAHHRTGAFAPGQMLTFDLGSHASSGLPPHTRVSVPAERSHVRVRRAPRDDGTELRKHTPAVWSLSGGLKNVCVSTLCATTALLSSPTHAEATAHYLQYRSLNFLLLEAGILCRSLNDKK